MSEIKTVCNSIEPNYMGEIRTIFHTLGIYNPYSSSSSSSSSSSTSSSYYWFPLTAGMVVPLVVVVVIMTLAALYIYKYGW